MAYFADLSPYDYPPFRMQSRSGLLNVGWLDAGVPYSKGAVDSGTLDRLIRLSEKPTNRTRGWHRCPFCTAYPARLKHGGRELVLGDAEIHIPGRDETVFACPTLICHYILDHGYRPPDKFLAAVSDLPQE
jgi:hypothetical protein